MATENYFENPRNGEIRKYAIRTIAESWKDGNFDAFIPYLAMNYFDRFVSRHPLPDIEEDERQNVRLVAICCLTISAKMRTNSFPVRQFLVDKFQDIHYKKILKGELSILSGLNWRMHSITAFCFLDYYHRRFPYIESCKRRCINEIIVQSQEENSFTQYKPSDMALSSLVAAITIAYHIPPMGFYTAIFLEESFPLACTTELIRLCKKKNIVIDKAESGHVATPSTQAAGDRAITRRQGTDDRAVTQGPLAASTQ